MKKGSPYPPAIHPADERVGLLLAERGILVSYVAIRGFVGRLVDPPLLVQLLDRFVDGGVEHDRIVDRLMGEVVTLRIPLAQFDVIEFQRATRQPLDDDPVSCRERCSAPETVSEDAIR